MAFQDWVPIVGGISGIVSLVLVFVLRLFPSTEGAGDRFLRWLRTHGPLWPLNRVVYAKALDRLTTPIRPNPTLGELEEQLDTLWERLALLDPVIKRHQSWFATGYFDSEGVKHPHNHRFLEFRIAWCLFWRGESYGKFQERLRDSTVPEIKDDPGPNWTVARSSYGTSEFNRQTPTVSTGMGMG